MTRVTCDSRLGSGHTGAVLRSIALLREHKRCSAGKCIERRGRQKISDRIQPANDAGKSPALLEPCQGQAQWGQGQNQEIGRETGNLPKYPPTEPCSCSDPQEHNDCGTDSADGLRA